MKITNAIRHAVGVAALAGFMSVSAPAFASFNDQYICDTGDADAGTLIIVSARDQTKAVLQIHDRLIASTARIPLSTPRIKPSGEFRYEGGGYAVLGRGDHALLLDGDATMVCTLAREEEEPDTTVGNVPHVALSGEGIAIHRPDTMAKPMQLPFGSPASVVILSRFLGTPGPQEKNDECGAGPLTFRSFGPLTLNFTDGRWVGWSLRQDDRTQDTAVPVFFGNKLMIGSQSSELPKNFKPVKDSTLGSEYFGDGVSAIIEDSKIANLWAGTNCIFR